jgi:elongator complex protein 2
MLDEFERKLAGEAGGSVQISTKAHVLSIDSEDGPSRYNITLEALLMGHEAGVTNITWSPSPTDPLLLSTSSDNSIILWTPSSNSTAKDGIWVPEQRFGATAGRGLGFHGPMWSTVAISDLWRAVFGLQMGITYFQLGELKRTRRGIS